MVHMRLAPLDATAAEEAARRNHYEQENVAESFWRKAAASLPPHVRRKHGHLFEAAERYEPVVDFIVEICEDAWRALITPARDRERRGTPRLSTRGR